MTHYTGDRPNEIFIGNTETKGGIPEHLRGLKTARLGALALDWDGRRIPHGDMLPLFIDRSEAVEYDRIMMGRMARRKHEPVKF